MILQVRGGSGAGKTTLVREFLRKHDGREVETVSSAKGSAYQVWQVSGVSCSDIYVPGKYSLDGVSPGKGGEHVEGTLGLALLLRLAATGDVLWETPKGSSYAFWEALTDQHRVVWATLDTPAAECVKRIYARRQATGRRLGKPLKEDSMTRIIEQRLRQATKPPPHVQSYWLDGEFQNVALQQVETLLGMTA